jgi:hypothetical protein
MMFDDATRGGPDDGMVAGHVTGDSTHRSALETAFRVARYRQAGHQRGSQRRGNQSVHEDSFRSTPQWAEVQVRASVRRGKSL